MLKHNQLDKVKVCPFTSFLFHPIESVPATAAASDCALLHLCFSLPLVFFCLLSPFSSCFFSFPSQNSRGDEVAGEQQPSLPLITVVTHGGATAAATCHPSPTLVRQEKDISRCKFASAVSMGRNRGGDGGGWEEGEGGQEGGSKEMRWGRDGWIEAEEGRGENK